MNDFKILLCANNWGGLQIAKFLVEENENVVGLVVHPPNKQKFSSEIVTEFTSRGLCLLLIQADKLNDEHTKAEIERMAPDLLVSYFSYRVPKYVLDKMPCINLHPGYLPTSRGLYSNVFSILDGVPGGATIHYMDEDFDTGDIIIRMSFPIRPDDVGETVHKRAVHKLLRLRIFRPP